MMMKITTKSETSAKVQNTVQNSQCFQQGLTTVSVEGKTFPDNKSSLLLANLDNSSAGIAGELLFLACQTNLDIIPFSFTKSPEFKPQNVQVFAKQGSLCC